MAGATQDERLAALLKLGDEQIDRLFSVPSIRVQPVSKLDADVLYDLVEIGGFHMEAGMRAYLDGSLPNWSYQYWSEKMLSDTDVELRPHLPQLWKQTIGWLRQLISN